MKEYQPSDPYVIALQRLCQAEGGHKPVADEIGANDQTIYQIISGVKMPSGNPRGVGPALRKKLTNRYPFWLKPAAFDIGGSDISLLPNLSRPLPVLSWVQAGKMVDIAEGADITTAEEWFSLYETKVGRNAFVLIVEGDSMTSPYAEGVSFPPGTRIVVDPDMAANPGDYVVAVDATTNRATFKKLHYEDGRWYLKPINPKYDLITIDSPAVSVIGKVTDYYTGGRL